MAQSFDLRKLQLLKMKKHMVKQTQANKLAKMNTCTRIPDSEIKIENIIPGSPVYIPYKRVKSVNRGQGKGSKGSKNLDKMQSNTESVVGMAHTKQTLTKADRETIDARNNRANDWAKQMAAEEAEKASPVPKTVPVPRKTNLASWKTP